MQSFNIHDAKKHFSQLVDSVMGGKEVLITKSGKPVAAICRLADVHRDPFDRIMLAQAMIEPLIFLTSDETLKKYSDRVELI